VALTNPIDLEVLDSPEVEGTQFSPDMKRWLSNVVDIVNASFASLDNYTTNLITASGVDIGGMGAGPINVTVTGLTASGYVNVNLISSSNPVFISNVTPGNGSFSITFSSDPGASAIIVYQAFIAKP
jgi:hypothetical protein